MTPERLFLEAQEKLCEQLPSDIQATLKKHEADGTLDNPEYQQAKIMYYSRHLCRTKPLPVYLMAAIIALQKDPTVNHTMFAPPFPVFTSNTD
jgi:L-proline amide hydrolase